MRGCDYGLTLELDLGDERFLASSPVFGMYILLTIPTLGAVFEVIDLREQCAVETTWTVYITELRPVYKFLRF